MTAPAPLVRSRTSDAVVDHIIDRLFAGELRPGDRIDLDAMAQTLEVSRIPIREALAQLERDGIVRIPQHRGAFVAAFDAGTVREAFELYALLSGLTSSRVAARREPAVVEALTEVQSGIERARDIDRFERLAGEFRRVINVAAGGPHLRALLRTFRGLVPATARVGMRAAMPREREYIADELAAIRRGSATVAGRIAIEHIRYSGECGVNILLRKGILAAEPEGTPAGKDDLLRLVRAMGAG